MLNTDVTSPDLSLAVAKRCRGGNETRRARISGAGETRFEWNVGSTQNGSEITNDLHLFGDVISSAYVAYRQMKMTAHCYR